jgi:oligopeptide/dipeptide ABC transporter ATP-binding protein
MTGTATPLLATEAVGHTYRQGSRTVHALDGVSLTLAAGEALGLLGESGSGKSTLARVVTGLLRPSSGRALLEGGPIRLGGRRVQPLFQDPALSLDPRWTVAASVGEALRLPPGARPARVAQLLADVGLGPELAWRFPHQCSGGQLQRVALARALGAEPALLVADEPTAALDPPAAAHISAILDGLRRTHGLAILYLGHDLGLARQLCTRLGVLYRGQLVELAPSAALWQGPIHPYTRLLWAAAPDLDPRRARQHAGGTGPHTEAEAVAEGGCPFAPRCPLADAACRHQRQEWRELAPEHWVACGKAGSIPPWEGRG